MRTITELRKARDLLMSTIQQAEHVKRTHTIILSDANEMDFLTEVLKSDNAVIELLEDKLAQVFKEMRSQMP